MPKRPTNTAAINKECINVRGASISDITSLVCVRAIYDPFHLPHYAICGHARYSVGTIVTSIKNIRLYGCFLSLRVNYYFLSLNNVSLTAFAASDTRP